MHSSSAARRRRIGVGRAAEADRLRPRRDALDARALQVKAAA